jgi:hypothetical protein
LSLRDKPDAEATLANEPVERHSMLIEAMVAHELAHCWRYSKGMWHRWPAAFAESATESQDSDANLTRQAMRATQREEAFADLVALAWVKRTRADDYSQVYAWLERIRADQPLEGSFHDTRPWLTLAKDAAAFATGTSPFEAANEVWAKGF